MAVVHAELMLIHPFRDGNGRCGRRATLMGLQAGLPILDFGGTRDEKRKETNTSRRCMRPWTVICADDPGL